MRENHYAIFAQFENFLLFQLQDKHNASFSICLGKGATLSNCKYSKKTKVIVYSQ